MRWTPTTASPRPCSPISNPKPSPNPSSPGRVMRRERASHFPGRHEPRLSRQLLRYIEEFKRTQKDRVAREQAERAEREANPRGKHHENKRDHFDLASFGRTAPEMVMSANSFRVLTELPVNLPLENAGTDGYC